MNRHARFANRFKRFSQDRIISLFAAVKSAVTGNKDTSGPLGGGQQLRRDFGKVITHVDTTFNVAPVGGEVRVSEQNPEIRIRVFAGPKKFASEGKSRPGNSLRQKLTPRNRSQMNRHDDLQHKGKEPRSKIQDPKVTLMLLVFGPWIFPGSWILDIGSFL